MRYFWGWLAALLVAVAAAIVLCPGGFGLVNISLGPNDRLRIMKVSLGTNHPFSLEPWWKRVLRLALPNRGARVLGPVEEWHPSTAHSTLVLWVNEIDAAGKGHASRLQQPTAILENGMMGIARVVEMPNRILRLEFPSFARDEENVPLQMHYGTNVVRFTVRNPQRVARPLWNASSLAKTNKARGAEVVLGATRIRHSGGAVPEYEAMIRTKANPPTQWWSWRVTTFDDLGNWSMTGPQNSSVVRIPGLPRTNSPWMLNVQGWEYISAGFLEPLSEHEVQVLHPHERARAYGVQAMLYVEPGHYFVTNGVPIRRPTLHLQGQEAQMHEFVPGTGANWSLRFETTLPSILWVVELDRDEAMPRLRLRERLPQNRGRIFPLSPTRQISNATGARMWVAALFAAQIPGNATNAEVEIIGTPPPMIFPMPSR